MPQSARLSEGGGCNRYLGNAHLDRETSSGVLPLEGKVLEVLLHPKTTFIEKFSVFTQATLLSRSLGLGTMTRRKGPR